MTLKGCQKKILQIKNPRSEWFEEAYFILKPSAKDVVEDDIVREAERVLKETSTERTLKFAFYSSFAKNKNLRISRHSRHRLGVISCAQKIFLNKTIKTRQGVISPAVFLLSRFSTYFSNFRQRISNFYLKTRVSFLTFSFLVEF